MPCGVESNVLYLSMILDILIRSNERLVLNIQYPISNTPPSNQSINHLTNQEETDPITEDLEEK
ncbi:hypothetical protein BOTCAL_0027g00350 [Botryotinia calthae]|uniref:Uncharacterized protein n=1 Tax=Botryotinia calthae TaxID=38488 RepID=A0A4Y8DDW7_9HELO|nr:hypothetical protein BOTCAL_0027g00350 [Botryotinia calthae]